jgi:hypothetical protein
MLEQEQPNQIESDRTEPNHFPLTKTCWSLSESHFVGRFGLMRVKSKGSRILLVTSGTYMMGVMQSKVWRVIPMPPSSLHPIIARESTRSQTRARLGQTAV